MAKWSFPRPVKASMFGPVFRELKPPAPSVAAFAAVIRGFDGVRGFLLEEWGLQRIYSKIAIRELSWSPERLYRRHPRRHKRRAGRVTRTTAGQEASAINVDRGLTWTPAAPVLELWKAAEERSRWQASPERSRTREYRAREEPREQSRRGLSRVLPAWGDGCPSAWNGLEAYLPFQGEPGEWANRSRSPA